MTTNERIYITVAGIVALMVALFSWAFFFPTSFYKTLSFFGIMSAEQARLLSNEHLTQAIESSWNRDNASAIRAAKSIVERGDTTDPNYFAALALQAESEFSAARTLGERIAAVELMKKFYIEAPTPRLKAIALNNLLTALYGSGERVVIEAAASGEPFASLYDPQDLAGSMLRAADYSIATYPLPAPFILKARVQTDRIFALTQPGTNVPLDGAADLGEMSADIAELVRQADEVYENEKAEMLRTPFSITVEPWFYFWRGHVLGGAARVDSSHLSEAEASFNRVIDLYTGDGQNQEPAYPILLPVAARAHLAYARLLHAVDSEGRASDIRSHLAAFVAFMQQDSPELQDLVRFFDRAKDGASITGEEWANDSRRRSYIEYMSLAKYSPELTEYLKQRGWAF